jgi:hypothetical protein
MCLQVAKGYIHRPAYSETRFMFHPTHGRVFRTGKFASLEGDSGMRRLYLQGGFKQPINNVLNNLFNA